LEYRKGIIKMVVLFIILTVLVVACIINGEIKEEQLDKIEEASEKKEPIYPYVPWEKRTKNGKYR